MTIELATKGMVYPKCQLLGIEADAMVYPRDQVSGIATKGIIHTRCLLVTKEEIAIATRDEILTDATKFAGANIDAAISSRATPSDVQVSVSGGGSGGGGGGRTIIERPAIWKPEEKLKLIEDIKKIHKMIDELTSLQSAGLENMKNNIEGLRESLLKLIKEEVTLLLSLKKIISKQPKTDASAALADSVNQIIAKWDSVQKSILKPSDLSSLDNKLDDLAKIMVKSLPNKALEDLINAE